MQTFGYEYFRIIGFPAIVENHITFGIGYNLSEKVAINLGYKHAFEKTIKETSEPITLESKLSEDAYDFGLTFKF
jgi:long-chain fatty acid transport protein